MGRRIKSERVCLSFLICRETAESGGEKQKGKLSRAFRRQRWFPERLPDVPEIKKSRTRPSIISDRTSCQAEFPAALQNFRVLPRSCFLKSVTPAVRYFRRCIGLCPKIEQPLPFPPCPMRITLMSIGGIADAAFPRGPCHGIMTASTLHAILSWFPRVFFQDRFPGI